ncbi:uncharacterized protein LOC115022267 [Cottoperca gobio]|uniref:Uncharacterized protein LOC115022267 n=1 Tax=Cottoperca gobio TaxID=56716 RepID=A0A6J2RFZ2_COTGO|nr:uncharacterized protein LOC115022267 [Cottoperca gobio]
MSQSFSGTQLGAAAASSAPQPGSTATNGSVSLRGLSALKRPQDNADIPQGFQVFRGSNWTISCSLQPQYPGGSFLLTFTSSNSRHYYTQPTVNHSADFLFPAAEPAHHGNYSCVYHVSVFSHNFFSESRLLSLTVSDVGSDPTPLIIRAVVLPLTLLLVNVALYFYCQASRGQKPGRRENMELEDYNLDVPAAEEEGAQGAE